MNADAQRLLCSIDVRCSGCGDTQTMQEDDVADHDGLPAYQEAAMVALQDGWRVGPRPGDTKCAACLAGEVAPTGGDE